MPIFRRNYLERLKQLAINDGKRVHQLDLVTIQVPQMLNECVALVEVAIL